MWSHPTVLNPTLLANPSRMTKSKLLVFVEPIGLGVLIITFIALLCGINLFDMILHQPVLKSVHKRLTDLATTNHGIYLESLHSHITRPLPPVENLSDESKHQDNLTFLFIEDYLKGNYSKLDEELAQLSLNSLERMVDEIKRDLSRAERLTGEPTPYQPKKPQRKKRKRTQLWMKKYNRRFPWRVYYCLLNINDNLKSNALDLGLGDCFHWEINLFISCGNQAVDFLGCQYVWVSSYWYFDDENVFFFFFIFSWAPLCVMHLYCDLVQYCFVIVSRWYRKALSKVLSHCGSHHCILSWHVS